MQLFLKREKQPSESVWSTKEMVVMRGKQPRLNRLIEWQSQGLKIENGFIFRQAWTLGNYAWIQFHVYTCLKQTNYAWFHFPFFYTSLKWEKYAWIGLHAPSMMKRRVSCNQMEITAVKQDGYPTPLWLRSDRQRWMVWKTNHITYRETYLYHKVHAPPSFITFT